MEEKDKVTKNEQQYFAWLQVILYVCFGGFVLFNLWSSNAKTDAIIHDKNPIIEEKTVEKTQFSKTTMAQLYGVILKEGSNNKARAEKIFTNGPVQFVGIISQIERSAFVVTSSPYGDGIMFICKYGNKTVENDMMKRNVGDVVVVKGLIADIDRLVINVAQVNLSGLSPKDVYELQKPI